MKYLYTAILLLASWNETSAWATPPTLRERRLVQRVVDNCPRRVVSPPLWHILDLVRLETTLGVTEWRPGLLGAIWCWEASFSTRQSVLGDETKAWGPFQLWPTHRRVCGLDFETSHDLEAAARCWVSRVEDVLPKARAKCPQLGGADLYRVAEAAVSNHHRYQWDCERGSRHWEISSPSPVSFCE